MANPEMQYDYDMILRNVAREAGLPAVADLDSTDAQELADILREAQLVYYYPPPLAPGAEPHVWSFLRPTYEVTTEADTWKYTLPDDFERFTGSLFYVGDSSGEIAVVPRGDIAEFRSGATSNGRPRFAATRAVQGDGTTAQKQELLLYPTPGEEFDIEGEYLAFPHLISSAKPYPMGGPIHSYGVLLACYAVAERRYDTSDGPRFTEFMTHLQTMIAEDGRRAPKILGRHRRHYLHRNVSSIRKAIGGVFGSPTLTHPWGE